MKSTLFVSVWVSLVTTSFAIDPVVRVGKRKQLLVDDYVVAQKTNLKFQLGQVTKLNGGKPLLVKDRPWEQSVSFYGTALHDGQKFQLWYRTGGERGPLAYATSKDGLNWTKPNLGLVRVNGSRKNNVVDKKLGLAYAFSCFIDAHETDPEHKYKCCWGHPRKIRACLGYSPDGLRWKAYNRGEPVTYRAADTHSQLLWDEDAGVYRLFTRTDFARRLRAKMEVRGHRMMTNPDVKKNPTAWKLAGREWYFNRKPKEYQRRQVYSMTDWIYQGVHFALITLYEFPQDMSEGGLDLRKRHERDIVNFYIATSRDAIQWDFRWVYANQPLVPRGPDGSFDKDMVVPPCNIITYKNRHWIYYGGFNERHGASKRDTAIGGATLRLDGMVSLAAGDQPGVVVTKPFKLSGKQLQVNVKADSLKIEVLDPGGRVLPGFAGKASARIDALRYSPTWDKDLAGIVGKTIRLRFTLRRGNLYAFQVK